MTNEKQKVFDVAGGKDKENQNILAWKKHGGTNQQWNVVYLDDLKPEPKKGEKNDDFGFRVNTPFHIVSKMKEGRYLDFVDGKKIVIKTPNGYKS